MRERIGVTILVIAEIARRAIPLFYLLFCVVLILGSAFLVINLMAPNTR